MCTGGGGGVDYHCSNRVLTSQRTSLSTGMVSLCTGSPRPPAVLVSEENRNLMYYLYGFTCTDSGSPRLSAVLVLGSRP